MARNQIQEKAKTLKKIYLILKEIEGKKEKELIKRLKNKILAYSAKKIKVNTPDLYSVLNPDTSSDSPSEKSNGVRFVSITDNTKINNTTIGIIKNIKVLKFKANLETIWEDWTKIIRIINIKDKLISYEIVWETPRRAPIKEYFLLEAQPDKNIG